MTSKKGIDNYHPEIATQVIERTLDLITPIDGTPLSLILPTIGDESNFELIAAGLKQLDGTSIDHMILIGSPAGQTSAETLLDGNFVTLVGKFDIDTNLARALVEIQPVSADTSISNFYSAFGQVLPFIKRVAPFAKILPILLDPADIETAQNIAQTLAEMLRDKSSAMVVLSNIDDLTLTAVEFGDINILRQSIPHIQSQTGANPAISPAGILAAVQFAQLSGSNTTTVLKSMIDVQKTTPTQRIVKASLMLYNYTPPSFVQAQEEELIELAKSAITSYITSRQIPKYTTDDPAYLRKTGIFVTLRQNGDLRGCIGRLQADMPLYRVLQEIAIAAATADPRFPPIRTHEINHLSFKIAVLSPMQRISINEIEVGKHGLLIAHKGRRGVLLPDVPVERGWDRQTFLENLCLKAGLPQNAWRENPTLYGFTAVEFGSD